MWDDEETYRTFKASTVRSPVPVPVIMGQAQAISTHDVGARLGEITVPTAVMHGTVDRMLPYPNGVAVHGGIPGATLTTFDEAGHLYFWDHAAETADILRELSARSPE